MAVSPASAPPLAPRAGGLDRTETALYAVLVLVWGTSWIALHFQLGVVAPEVSLVWRFALATALCFAIAAIRRQALAYPRRLHGRFALAGVLMYSTNFLLFYYAGAHVPTGLLAVVFALASPINIALGAVVYRRAVEARVLLGAALGVAGVGLLYAPEIADAGLGPEAFGGLGLCVAGTLCFCLGNMVSGSLQAEVPDVPATAWGMLYGTLWTLVLALATGATFTVEPTLTYALSLLWLAAASSVAAFLAYLALLKRIGAARAGFATVLFPVVALAISSVVEDYQWGVSSAAGIVLVAAGNVVVLGLIRRNA